MRRTLFASSATGGASQATPSQGDGGVKTPPYVKITVGNAVLGVPFPNVRTIRKVGV